MNTVKWEHDISVGGRNAIVGYDTYYLLFIVSRNVVLNKLIGLINGGVPERLLLFQINDFWVSAAPTKREILKTKWKIMSKNKKQNTGH